MVAAYESGDPYLKFGQQAGGIPPSGTKVTHGPAREQFKAVSLAVQYGMGADSLAQRLGQPVSRARELLQLHRQTYRTFWAWSDHDVDVAGLRGWTQTVLGWRCHLGREMNLRAVRNFPMQAHGAEILRLACCRATASGIRLLAPVHDALLVEAPLDQLDPVAKEMQTIMTKAGEQILGGFSLRIEVKKILPPNRYQDARGVRMWEVVQGLVAELRYASAQ
jgi:DNA polymerase I